MVRAYADMRPNQRSMESTNSCLQASDLRSAQRHGERPVLPEDIMTVPITDTQSPVVRSRNDIPISNQFDAPVRLQRVQEQEANAAHIVVTHHAPTKETAKSDEYDESRLTTTGPQRL